MDCPLISLRASVNASDKVGCAWITSKNFSIFNSVLIAIVASPINSDALVPIIIVSCQSPTGRTNFDSPLTWSSSSRHGTPRKRTGGRSLRQWATTRIYRHTCNLPSSPGLTGKEVSKAESDKPGELGWYARHKEAMIQVITPLDHRSLLKSVQNLKS